MGKPAKRAFDVLVSIVMMLLLSPIMGIVAVLIRLRLGKPVIFRQERPGKDTRPFHVCKFRTMGNGCDNDGNLLPDHLRMEKLGAALRRLSLDELPQLWNVLKGEMSLVGPRPLLMRYLGSYTETEMLRFSMRPGITGWAQIHGRNFACWDQRLQYDVWYVTNWNFLLDLRILARTVIKVIRRDDVAPAVWNVMPDLDQERSKEEAGV